MFRKYSVYLPWILGFTILFILSIPDGPWPPATVTPTIITPSVTTKNPIWGVTTTTPGPISTTTPTARVPSEPTTTTPYTISTTTTPNIPPPISTTTTPTATVSAVPTTVTPTPTFPIIIPLNDGSVVPTTVTPEPGPKSITPSPTPDPIDEQAVQIAGTVAPLFETSYDVKFSPARAQGQSAAPAGGSAKDLVGVVVPVAYEKQMYEDENGRTLEVQGILSIEPPLYVEIEIVVENAPVQYSRLQTGNYMVACTTAAEKDPNQLPDCIAVSEQGIEFAIRPDRVDTDAGKMYRAPTAEFIYGSVHACFRVRGRRICVRAF